MGRVVVALVLVVLASCGGDDDFVVPPRDATVDAAPPAELSGVYSLAVTNGANGCAFGNWTDGAVAQNVPFTITQADANVTGEITGITGSLVMLGFGSRTFTGTVDARGAFTMTLIGSRAEMQNQCTYTRKATATGMLAGDSISGMLDYTTMTNGSPDCGSLEGCHTIQRYSGSRPPR
jgi:hypothetical protein